MRTRGLLALILLSVGLCFLPVLRYGEAKQKADLEFLSYQHYVDAEWFHIVGEVRNNSHDPMEYVKVVATLYDDSGKVVGVSFTYTELDVIPPGQKAPFETVTDQWEGTTRYKLQVQGSPGHLPRQDLKILSHDSYVDGDWFHVRGEIKNRGTTQSEFVKIVATLYNASGEVVGMAFAYAELDVVPAGGTSPFDIVTAHWPNVHHYAIQVQG